MGTTKLHVDMADAVNVLVHVEDAGSGLEEGVSMYGELLEPTVGAVWHIFSQADTKTLETLLPRIVSEVGTREEDDGMLGSTIPLLDSVIYLDEPTLLHLREVADITPYVLLQRLGDAVLLPAGCAHQAALPPVFLRSVAVITMRHMQSSSNTLPPPSHMRSAQVLNLRSCIKVAADFVSPEHVGQCVRITEELRQLPVGHHRHADVLNVRSILVSGASIYRSLMSDSA